MEVIRKLKWRLKVRKIHCSWNRRDQSQTCMLRNRDSASCDFGCLEHPSGNRLQYLGRQYECSKHAAFGEGMKWVGQDSERWRNKPEAHLRSDHLPVILALFMFQIFHTESILVVSLKRGSCNQWTNWCSMRSSSSTCAVDHILLRVPSFKIWHHQSVLVNSQLVSRFILTNLYGLGRRHDQETTWSQICILPRPVFD